MQVAGQSSAADLLGNFTITGITLADTQGSTPGSGPDFVGDDLVRVVAVRGRTGPGGGRAAGLVAPGSGKGSISGRAPMPS